jgi:hypothetical protein
MKKLLAALLFAPTLALAVGIGNDNPPSEGGSTTIEVKPIIDASARARAEAYAASLSASKASAVSSPTLNSSNASTASTGASTSTSTSGSNSLTVNESGNVHYSGTYNVKNTPSVLVGNVYPTAPCMGSSTIGGSGPGFGIGFGTSWTDDECGIRETARSFSGLGLKEDAVSVLCTSKYAKIAPACAVKETKE